MTQSGLETILWAVSEIAAYVVAAVVAFWLARRAETNRQKFERAVGVLVVYSIVVALGYVAWGAADSTYTIYGAIYLGTLVGAFHFMLMAVITSGVLWLTLRR